MGTFYRSPAPDQAAYVEVGSPSNALGQPDRARGAIGQDPTEFLKTHGGYWSFAADQPDQTDRKSVV